MARKVASKRTAAGASKTAKSASKRAPARSVKKSTRRASLKKPASAPRKRNAGTKRASATRSSGLYSVHPSIAWIQAQMAKLAERTGRDMSGWIEFLKINGPRDEPSQREWLKTRFGLGTNYAGWITERAAGRGLEDGDPYEYLRMAPQYVEEMYAGGKADLRPIHDKIVALARKLGPEVKLCPCQTLVPIYRNHVIAQIKPATRKRIDLGFALGDLKPTGRLIDTGGFAKKDRITHRIPIESLDDLDAEVTGWLRRAFEGDA